MISWTKSDNPYNVPSWRYANVIRLLYWCFTFFQIDEDSAKRRARVGGPDGGEICVYARFFVRRLRVRKAIVAVGITIRAFGCSRSWPSSLNRTQVKGPVAAVVCRRRRRTRVRTLCSLLWARGCCPDCLLS